MPSDAPASTRRLGYDFFFSKRLLDSTMPQAGGPVNPGRVVWPTIVLRSRARGRGLPSLILAVVRPRDLDRVRQYGPGTRAAAVRGVVVGAVIRRSALGVGIAGLGGGAVDIIPGLTLAATASVAALWATARREARDRCRPPRRGHGNHIGGACADVPVACRCTMLPADAASVNRAHPAGTIRSGFRGPVPYRERHCKRRLRRLRTVRRWPRHLGKSSSRRLSCAHALFRQ